MPISKHFGGHGAEVMKDMKKRYGSKKGERVFYATENKRMESHMPKGAKQSPSGDIGAKRQAESTKVGGFKAGSTVKASKAFK